MQGDGFFIPFVILVVSIGRTALTDHTFVRKQDMTMSLPEENSLCVVPSSSSIVTLNISVYATIDKDG